MVPIGVQDVMGFAAAASSLLAVSQAPVLRTRAAAVASNVFFIVYGGMGPLYPALFLHSILLPLNLRHLVRELKTRKEGGATRATPRY
jgi:hypothetical protein